jgi:hypothetical protein
MPLWDVAGADPSIDRGEVCIMIASPQHVKAVDALLDRQGKVVYQDAAASLEKFMVDGHPDRLRFLDTIGDMVEQAALAGAGKVRAFGEMVVLLCERGQPEAAHELETLWNELAARQDMRLLCSYPISAVEGHAKPMAAALRDTHSHAVPAT